MHTNPDAFQTAWSGALERSLRPFFALCFPSVSSQIDWSREVVVLNADLEELEREKNIRGPHVDKLFQVFTTNRSDGPVSVHVEILNWPDPEMARRVFEVHEWLYLRYDRPTACFAVLADADPKFRPNTFDAGGWGYRLELRFPICKLLDFSEEQLAGWQGEPIAQLIHERLRVLRSER